MPLSVVGAFLLELKLFTSYFKSMALKASNTFTEHTCRVCLQDVAENSLNDHIIYMDMALSLWTLLEDVAQVQRVANAATEPTNICESCTNRLYDAYDFINLVTKSHQMLQNTKPTETVEIKFEPTNNEISPIRNFSDNIQYIDEEYLLLDDCDGGESNDYVILPEESAEEVNKDLPTLSDVPSKPSTAATTQNLPEQDTQLNRGDKSTHNCKQCPRTFAKLESLFRHMQRAHTEIQQELHVNIKTDQPNTTAAVAAVSTPNITDITCKYCPRVFKRIDTLQRHLKAFHTEEAEESETGSNTQIKRRVYKRDMCPYCGVSFPISSLKIHIRRHTGENPYKCDRCERGYPRRQDLVIHQRMHSGERPSTCSICAKSFISQNKLARHMRLHTGQRPFKCDKCEKRFVQSNDMKIHMRRHTGERPYECGICNERFISGAQLTIHRRAKMHFDTDKSDVVDPHANSRVNKRRAKEMEALRLRQTSKLIDTEEIQLEEIVVEHVYEEDG